MAADLYEKILSSLRGIYFDIVNLNRIKNKVDFKTKKRIIIEDLDKIEKIIMKGDWGDDSYQTRLELRSKIYELYKKLPYCPPKRSKRQYTLHSSEYEDPEAISDREDLSNCPERNELFQKTNYTNNFNKKLIDMNLDNELTKMENYFLQKLKDIDDQIYVLKTKSVGTDDYNIKRKAIIEQLDAVEEEIMKNDWGVFFILIYVKTFVH